MRQAKLHELAYPSTYFVWYKYAYPSKIKTMVNPDRFAEVLERNGAIELINLRGHIICKILDKTKIDESIEQIWAESLYSPLWHWLRKLVRRATTRTGSLQRQR